MHIATTLHIRCDLLEKVNAASKKMNISRSGLVSILLLKYMETNRAGMKSFASVAYQERQDDSSFTTKSLCLREDVYEKWCDVRKAFKFSASYIIAMAIEKYLDEIVHGQKIPYNYFSMYITNTTYHDNVCIIQTLWGVAGEKILAEILKNRETADVFQ